MTAVSLALLGRVRSENKIDIWKCCVGHHIHTPCRNVMVRSEEQ